MVINISNPNVFCFKRKYNVRTNFWGHPVCKYVSTYVWCGPASGLSGSVTAGASAVGTASRQGRLTAGGTAHARRPESDARSFLFSVTFYLPLSSISRWCGGLLRPDNP